MADHDHGEKVSQETSDENLDGNTEIGNNASSHRGSASEMHNQPNMDKDQLRANINAKINNPLAGFTHDQLATKGEEYVRKFQIGNDEDIRAFRMGAILAQDPNRHSEVRGLTEEESMTLGKEISNRWSQPKLLYLVIVLCSVCAAVQGMGKSKSTVIVHDGRVLSALQNIPISHIPIIFY